MQMKSALARLSSQQISRPSLDTVSALAINASMALATGLLAVWVMSQPSGSLQIAAGVSFLVIVALVVFADTITGRLDIANIKYVALFGFALFLGLGMIADVFGQDYAFNGAAIILAYASLILFLGGFGLVRRHRVKSKYTRPTFSITPNQLFYLSIIFFLLGFAVLFLEWQLYGVLVTYSGGLASETRETSTAMPYIHTFTQLVFPASVMALIQIRRGIIFIRKYVLASLLATALAYYFLGGSRSSLVWLAIAVMIVWAEVPDRRGNRRLGLRPFVVCLVALAVVLILSSIRSRMSIESAQEISPANTVEETWKSLDTYTQFRRTLEFFPKHADYLWGYSFYGVVVNPIPRVFWEDKPIGVGKLASMLYDGTPHNSIGLSLPGELYANFGIVGALMGMFFSGLLMGVIYRWYQRQRGDYGALVIYVLVLSYVVWEVRGDILDATMPFFYYVLPVAACLALVSTMNRIRFRNLALAAGTGRSKAKAGQYLTLTPNTCSPEPSTD